MIAQTKRSDAASHNIYNVMTSSDDEGQESLSLMMHASDKVGILRAGCWAK
jgi:hypothetical protein